MAETNRTASTASEAIHRHLRTREELRAGMLELIGAARADLAIAAPALDASLFSGSDLGSAIAHFLTRRAANRVRIVVEDTEHMLATSTRIVELARRLSDKLFIRRLGEVHHGMDEMFMVADRKACLAQHDVHVIDATLDIGTPRLAAPFALRFEELWDAAEPVPGLHSFRL